MRLKDCNAERLLPEVVSPNRGVTINIKELIEHVRLNLSRDNASRIRH